MSSVQQLKNAMARHAAAAVGDTPLSALMNMPTRSSFDPTAWHAMQERDNALIRDEIMHGYNSGEFVYAFLIKGKLVVGTSVVGARELVSQYKGIRARIVATIDKTGGLFVFRTFSPLSIETRELPSLADDPDYYECVMSVEDTKTGNSIEVRKKEPKTERTRAGDTYDRPHYDTIAESKAFRNGVLSVLPQAVIQRFELDNLKAGLPFLEPDVQKAVKAYLEKGKGSPVSDTKTIDQYRDGVLAAAAKSGLQVNRAAVMRLTYAEISGLGSAIKEGADAFRAAAEAVGIVVQDDQGGDDTPPPPPAPPAPKVEGPKGSDKRKDNGAGDEPPPLGEKRPPAQDQQQEGGGPTLEDAMAAVRDGRFGDARDIARGLDKDAAQAIEGAIASRQNNGQADQPAARRRAPANTE